MSLPTTRRGRFLYRRQRYLMRVSKWQNRKWKWSRDPDGVSIRIGLKLLDGPWPLQLPCGVSSKSYDASPDFTDVFFVLPVVSEAGRAMPPHVKFTSEWYQDMRAAGVHQSSALYGYHAKRVRAMQRVGRWPNSAFNRRITGCNYHYRVVGYYPDDDPLGRRPNDTDRANGVPRGPEGWPNPLGYEQI